MVRNVQKELATVQDIVHGVGKVSQQRGQQMLELDKVDIPFGVSTLAEAMGKSPDSYPRVRAGSIELQAVNSTYQQTHSVKPVIYTPGYVLTEDNPYVYYASAIYKRIVDLPYTLTNATDDGLATVNPDQWQLYLASGAGASFTLEPVKDVFTVADLDVNNGFNLVNVQYQPNQDMIWVMAMGTKLKVTADYVETTSTRVEFTADFVAGVDPNTELEVWTNLLVPIADIPLARVSFDDTRSQLGVSNGQDAIDALAANIGLFITLEQFDPFAGTGGDDTAAFNSACAASFSTGKPIRLLAKTYLVDSRSNTLAEDQIKIKTGIFGVDGSVIKVRNRLTTPESISTQALLYFLDMDNITLSNFTFDGNLSEDPTAWDATNFNTFYGSWGITFGRCSNINLINVKVKNTFRAGITTRDTENVYLRGCRTERTRGKFGDGFYICGKNFLVEDCYAYDYTRIGFVIETPREQPYLSTRYQFNSCVAKFGHDSSDQYGDTERNAGFWFENYDTAACYKCTAINSGDRGFTMANSYRPAGTEGAVDITPGKDEVAYCTTTYDTCEVIDTGTYGFTINSLVPDFRGQVDIRNCRGTRQNLFIHINALEDDRVKVDVENTHCTSLFGTNTTFLMLRGGSATIKNSTMRFLDVTELEYDDIYTFKSGNNAGFANTFSTSCGHDIEIDSCKLFKKDYTEIPAIVKIRNDNSRARCNLIMRNVYTTQLEENFKTARYINCTFKETGSVKADIVHYKGCVSYGTSRPMFADASTKEFLISDCLFDFTSASPEQSLYLYSGADRGSRPNIVVNNCTIVKNFELDGYGLRLNAATELKAIQGIHNYEINNCVFVNTGGVTSNPIVDSNMTIEANPAILLGSGNVKSETLLTNVSAFVIPNWDIKPVNATVAEPVSIATSRNIALSDINREVTNSTGTAVVLTLLAGTNGSLPIGTELTLTKLGTGNISFTPTAPTTINGTTTFAVSTQYSSRKIRKVSASAWVTV